MKPAADRPKPALAANAPAAPQLRVLKNLAAGQRRAACEQRGIVLEAYSPLTHGRNLDDREVAEIAERLGRTPAQVLLRWGIQHNLPVIPKSKRRERIEENAQIFDFELSDEDMGA